MNNYSYSKVINAAFKAMKIGRLCIVAELHNLTEHGTRMFIAIAMHVPGGIH